MPLRYHKEIKLGDFIKLNINKKSMSLSAGVPGLHFNIGPAGPMVNVDLPGGLSYRKYFGKPKKEEAEEPPKAKQAEPAPTSVELAPARAEAAPASGGIVPADAKTPPASEPAPAEPQIPPEEAPFQLGFIGYQHGDFVQAYRHFTALTDSPYRSDALFMAGITSSYLKRDDEAVTYLGTLLEEGQPPFPGDPESLVTRYLPGTTINIQVTPFTAVDLPLEPAAALLLLVELLQLDEQLDAAAAMVEEVFRQNPGFRLAQLSLADLYFEQGRYDDIYNLFSQHTPELEAEDDIAVEIMYYWALALTTRKMFDAADKVYRRALARKKGINPDLRLMVLYGRADLYERRGKHVQARKAFEKVFAEAPDFFDVQQRIAALPEVQITTGLR
jgi:tetratricopeptide (TPR) repeat protein